MLRSKHVLVWIGAAAAALALACFEPERPAAVTVRPATAMLDAVGDAKRLTAKATDKDGQEMTDVIFTWASSAPTVATVDSEGTVTAVAPGTSDVSATAAGVSGTARVSVAQVASKVEATSGAEQTGTVAQPLPQQIVVRVRDRLDHAIPGVAVTFTVSANGGTVTPSSGTTGPDGQLSATWTLGTAAGSFQATANVVAGAILTATFNAKANPGPANNLAKAAGDNQFGFQGTRLAQLVAVRVRDQYGNGVPSHAVQFSAPAGNGTVDSAIAFSDSSGVARSGWVMPSTPGIDTVELQVASLSGAGAPLLGSPATFTAIAHNVRVTGWSPGTLGEGQPATVTGSGFDAGNTRNVVTVDGVAAAVTGATATDLNVTVPAYDCRPARNVAVQVTVAGIPAAPVSVPLNPALAALNLTVGQQTIVSDPAQFCFQFGTQVAEEAYLIGVQSTSEAASTITPITLIATGTGTGGAAPAPRVPPQQGPLPLRDARLMQRWERYRAAELRQRALDRQMFPQLRASAGRAARQGAAIAAVVPDSAKVGDTLQVRVSTGSCTVNYKEITTVVQAKGATGFFLADITNPAGGFTATQFTGFSEQYDAKIYPVDVAQFGAPADRDANGRIVIVVTKEVNKLGPLGFTTSCDLSDRASYPASNEGEFFYVAAPDPTGAVGDTLDLAFATENFPDVLAHEFVHVIQFARRAAAGAPQFLDTWVAEGQAVLGEEVVGHTILGNAGGANYGLDHVITAQGRFLPWYAAGFVGLGFYFGWDPITVRTNPNGSVANAPWECTFLSTDYGPCVGDLEIYGPSWSLLRHLSDRYGPTHIGGEAGIQKAIIESPETGFAMLRSVIGVSADTLLAHWAAMLFVDDITENWGTLAPALSLASWNLDNVFYGNAYGYAYYSSGRLKPVAVSFSTFSNSANVRAASAYYSVIHGSNRLPVAVKARGASGTGFLPSTMRYWIVRVQ